MKRIIVGALISLMVTQAAYAKIVAKVGNLEISDQEVDARLKQLPPQYQQAYSSEQGRKQFLDQLTQERLVYLQAEKEKYGDHPEVLKQLAQVKQNLMVRQFMADSFERIKATEAELKKYYDENTSEFITQAKVKAGHILCKTEEEAEAAKNRVLKGEAFEDVAREVSTGPSGKNGGDLGWFSKGQMVAEFETAAFALEKDGLSAPVKTQFGFHIIKVYDIKAAETTPFEAARADLEKKVNQDKQKQFMDEIIRKLKKENPITIY